MVPKPGPQEPTSGQIEILTRPQYRPAMPVSVFSTPPLSPQPKYTRSSTWGQRPGTSLCQPPWETSTGELVV